MVQTLGDILAAAPEERRWTVEGILPESGLAVLGGHSKAGQKHSGDALRPKRASGRTFSRSRY